MSPAQGELPLQQPNLLPSPSALWIHRFGGLLQISYLLKKINHLLKCIKNNYNFFKVFSIFTSLIINLLLKPTHHSFGVSCTWVWGHWDVSTELDPLLFTSSSFTRLKHRCKVDLNVKGWLLFIFVFKKGCLSRGGACRADPLSRCTARWVLSQEAHSPETSDASNDSEVMQKKCSVFTKISQFFLSLPFLECLKHLQQVFLQASSRSWT